MALETAFDKKTDEDIVDSLIQDTLADKIQWHSDDVYIFTKLQVDKNINIIFRISDKNYEEEEDEYIESYGYYEMNVHEIVLTIAMKKKTLEKEIFIKKVNTSQMQLMYLVDHAMAKLKK